MTTLAAAMASAVTIAAAPPAWAQQAPEITLKSRDGFTQLRGTLQNFDGATYTITTALGTIQVNARQVTCEGEGCPEDQLYGAEFGVAGSNTIGDTLMPSLIESYAYSLDAEVLREMSTTPGESTLRIRGADGRDMATIALATHGSSTAFDGLASNAVSIGMSSRAARDADVEKLGAAGIPDPRDTPAEHIVALDGLAVIVHPDNPVRSLSVDDIGAIFGGDVTNWSEVGGPDMPIVLHARDDRSGTFDTFDSLVLRPSGYEIAPSAKRYEENVALSDAVSQDPRAIGFTGLSFARAAKVLAVRQSCGIVSEPTTFAVKTEEYPLSRRLYLYENPNNMPGHARNLIAFAQSDEAQATVEDAGFVSLALERRTLAEEGARILYSIASDEEFSLPLMKEMIAELGEAQRLSFSFRFTPGSSRLDTKSLLDVQRLADRIAAGQFAGKELILVGFTDSIGQFELNRGLGIRRAQGVLDEIVLVAGQGALQSTNVIVQGYGELTPVGCNDTFQGRFANRRVEVWVRDARAN